MEALSGKSLDDVKVHYNSDQPAQFKAHAFAQGTDIHVAPGQEKHLGHEAWHVVQQKQGRVQPTKQLKGKVNVNDDPALEREADVMGAKAKQRKGEVLNRKGQQGKIEGKKVQRRAIQRQVSEDEKKPTVGELWRNYDSDGTGHYKEARG